ncbi:MAG: hypothetical protein HKN03_05840 [Acidimicrobiales bacterium]|nr:hypothetical protein [Acidimicrobiales bacterium]
MSEQERAKAPTGGLCSVDGIDHYRIDGVEQMHPFLMTVVSDSDLWMFVSSTGALTAGRVDADHVLFPYETDDKLHQRAGVTGPVTVIARIVDGRRELWRPFASDIASDCTRSIAKSVLGDRVVFEEHNCAWDLRFRSTWAPSSRFGWVRSVEISNGNEQSVELEVLDGFLDVMPAGVDAHTEQTRSNLVDSYKRSETGQWGSLAVYTLESLITDQAEPAESLTATTVWSAGFTGAELDLNSHHVSSMIEGPVPESQQLVTGRSGAYLLRGPITVPSSGASSWQFVADTGLTHAQVLDLSRSVSDLHAVNHVTEDITKGSERLRGLLAGADAFQATADGIADAHHLSNVLFNSMRGGVFPYGNKVPRSDLSDFVHIRNHDVSQRWHTWLDELDSWTPVTDLLHAAQATGDADLIRLVLEYLPLTFSRRHGDPSRPWNKFSIKVQNDDGDELLSYEGNWRDIFQNWEALLRSFPVYHVHVVAKFVNASTIDGHNPYRISRHGIDWEVPDPDDPWSHIGYWGDHQIIYLLRLLEAWESHEPGAIGKWLDRPVFVYADVPYLIADHDAMVANPKNTITFDERRAEAIEQRELKLGSDGRLLVDEYGALMQVGLLEKLLVPALAKLTSFVPEGGIWLNTQRPEWNDANNALAGGGLSMVTLYHLRRYLDFLNSQLADWGHQTVAMTTSVAGWFQDLLEVFERFSLPVQPVDDHARRAMVDALGMAGTEHRRRIRTSTDPSKTGVPVADLRRLLELAITSLERSIQVGRRNDGMYHSYNRLSFPNNETARVHHLGTMLEGQVAVLSSGALNPEEALALTKTLFESDLYRQDQNSFVLYPVVELPPFLHRNIVPSQTASTLLQLVGRDRDSLRSILAADTDGQLRFRPEIINAGVLTTQLERTSLSLAERDAIFESYEQVFHHSSFTGRSGSMYGYEGIGSVYWHMVAKLLLVVQETYFSARTQHAEEDVVRGLAEMYSQIRSGLGFRKGPAEFGAFPTDCYSHTPAHAGAQQPGMTGQVKEEVLTRFGELGMRISDGRISLSPGLLDSAEIIPAEGESDRSGPASFTYCAMPMTLSRGGADEVKVISRHGTQHQRDGLELTAGESKELFERTGEIVRVEWTIGPDW